MATKLTKGELMDIAEDEGIDPEQSYNDLRSKLDIQTCRKCGDEFVYSMFGKYCSDTCQVEARA